MSDNENKPLEERLELLQIFADLVLLRQSGRHPEKYKRYIEHTRDVLRKNGASEKSLKEAESYLTKVGADVLPLDEKRSTKLLWKIMKDLILDYYKRNGKKK